MDITIRVSDTLGQQLQRVPDRLTEVLERGLREVLADETGAALEERAIIEALTTTTTPDQVLAIRPSPQLQARASELLWRSKAGVLAPTEAAELERYLLLEHLVRLAKINAYKQRPPQ